MSGVLEHLEFHFGPIKESWSKDGDGVPVPFPIARFDDRPFPDSIVLSTVGLSSVPLRSSTSGKTIHQELVMVLRSPEGPLNLPSVLQELAKEFSRSGRALLRGEVLGPRGVLIEGTILSAFYVAPPTCFPDSFQRLIMPDGIAVVFPWLVPITREEAHFVVHEGWERFEEVLGQMEPDDLLDIYRETFVPE